MSSNVALQDESSLAGVARRSRRLRLENDPVGVLETIIPPGDRTTDHNHRWSSVQ